MRRPNLREIGIIATEVAAATVAVLATPDNLKAKVAGVGVLAVAVTASRLTEPPDNTARRLCLPNTAENGHASPQICRQHSTEPPEAGCFNCPASRVAQAIPYISKIRV